MQEVTAQARTLGRDLAFLIKWNPRSTPVERIATHNSGVSGIQQPPHPPDLPAPPDRPVRRIYRLTERTIDKRGQPLLLPEYVLEGWTTTLPARINAAQVIALYAEHGTHEQFHSEFKSDMNLERLPSGKFDTNYLICQLAAVAMNVRRLMGLNTLHGEDAPVRHKAVRRRIKTVMQEMIYKAGRMIHHAGSWALGLGGQRHGACGV